MIKKIISVSQMAAVLGISLTAVREGCLLYTSIAKKYIADS